MANSRRGAGVRGNAQGASAAGARQRRRVAHASGGAPLDTARTSDSKHRSAKPVRRSRLPTSAACRGRERTHSSAALRRKARDAPRRAAVRATASRARAQTGAPRCRGPRASAARSPPPPHGAAWDCAGSASRRVPRCAPTHSKHELTHALGREEVRFEPSMRTTNDKRTVPAVLHTPALLLSCFTERAYTAVPTCARSAWTEVGWGRFRRGAEAFDGGRG